MENNNRGTLSGESLDAELEDIQLILSNIESYQVYQLQEFKNQIDKFINRSGEIKMAYLNINEGQSVVNALEQLKIRITEQIVISNNNSEQRATERGTNIQTVIVEMEKNLGFIYELKSDIIDGFERYSTPPISPEIQQEFKEKSGSLIGTIDVFFDLYNENKMYPEVLLYGDKIDMLKEIKETLEKIVAQVEIGEELYEENIDDYLQAFHKLDEMFPLIKGGADTIQLDTIELLEDGIIHNQANQLEDRCAKYLRVVTLHGLFQRSMYETTESGAENRYYKYKGQIGIVQNYAQKLARLINEFQPIHELQEADDLENMPISDSFLATGSKNFEDKYVAWCNGMKDNVRDQVIKNLSAEIGEIWEIISGSGEGKADGSKVVTAVLTGLAAIPSPFKPELELAKKAVDYVSKWANSRTTLTSGGDRVIDDVFSEFIALFEDLAANVEELYKSIDDAAKETLQGDLDQSKYTQIMNAVIDNLPNKESIVGSFVDSCLAAAFDGVPTVNAKCHHIGGGFYDNAEALFDTEKVTHVQITNALISKYGASKPLEEISEIEVIIDVSGNFTLSKRRGATLYSINSGSPNDVTLRNFLEETNRMFTLGTLSASS